MNWLKKAILLILLIIVSELKKLTTTQKLIILQIKYLTMINVLLLMILINFQTQNLIKIKK